MGGKGGKSGESEEGERGNRGREGIGVVSKAGCGQKQDEKCMTDEWPGYLVTLSWSLAHQCCWMSVAYLFRWAHLEFLSWPTMLLSLE